MPLDREDDRERQKVLPRGPPAAGVPLTRMPSTDTLTRVASLESRSMLKRRYSGFTHAAGDGGSNRYGLSGSSQSHALALRAGDGCKAITRHLKVPTMAGRLTEQLFLLRCSSILLAFGSRRLSSSTPCTTLVPEDAEAGVI